MRLIIFFLTVSSFCFLKIAAGENVEKLSSATRLKKQNDFLVGCLTKQMMSRLDSLCELMYHLRDNSYFKTLMFFFVPLLLYGLRHTAWKATQSAAQGTCKAVKRFMYEYSWKTVAAVALPSLCLGSVGAVYVWHKRKNRSDAVKQLMESIEKQGVELENGILALENVVEEVAREIGEDINNVGCELADMRKDMNQGFDSLDKECDRFFDEADEVSDQLSTILDQLKTSTEEHGELTMQEFAVVKKSMEDLQEYVCQENRAEAEEAVHTRQQLSYITAQLTILTQRMAGQTRAQSGEGSSGGTTTQVRVLALKD